MAINRRYRYLITVRDSLNELDVNIAKQRAVMNEIFCERGEKACSQEPPETVDG